MGSSLEAIRFSRTAGHATLQLLEQRALPLETRWIAIDGPKAAWTAIRDMTVRGAPAIGTPPPLAPTAGTCLLHSLRCPALPAACPCSQ